MTRDQEQIPPEDAALSTTPPPDTTGSAPTGSPMSDEEFDRIWEEAVERGKQDPDGDITMFTPPTKRDG